jgi:hypothetical protein
MGDAGPMSSDADVARDDPTSIRSPPGFAKASPGEQGGGEADTHDAAELHDAPAHDTKTIDWREVRRVYELGADSVPAILERFGLTPWQFRKVRESENWTTRRPAAKPGPLQGHKPVGEESLELRLNRLVAICSVMLEQKIADEGFNETNARALRELCHAQEIRMRSTRSEKAAKAREKKNHDAGYDFRDDPVWLRAELERRLDHLFGQGGLESSSRNDDARAATGDRSDVESSPA